MVSSGTHLHQHQRQERHRTVLKRLAADKVSEPVSDYYLLDTAANIQDLCNEWVSKGYSAAALRDAGWRGGGKSHNETWYLGQLYAAIGIRASEAAQQLLGRAKSLKSVGGLERFVREYMLDEPQIDPLVSARNDLEVAQHKYRTLDGIEDAYETFAAEAARLASVTTIERKHAAYAKLTMLIGQVSAVSVNLAPVEVALHAARTRIGVYVPVFLSGSAS